MLTDEEGLYISSIIVVTVSQCQSTPQDMCTLSFWNIIYTTDLLFTNSERFRRRKSNANKTGCKIGHIMKITNIESCSW